MTDYKPTLKNCEDIISEYGETAAPSGEDLRMWKVQLFAGLNYLKTAEKRFEHKYLERVIFNKKQVNEKGKGYTDLLAESKARTEVPDYRFLKAKNEIIQSVCISIQQDIKTLQQELLNSKYDGST